MISPLSGTSLTKRCSRCGQQFPYNERHRCTDGGETRTVAEPTQSGSGSLDPGIAEVVADPVLGAVLGERYLMQRRLSQGGMGVVYKARHVLLDSPVAVKILLQPQDPVAQQRFLQEAKLASTVKHPNTVYISDFGVLSDGRSYLVMELLKGPTLSRVIADGAIDTLRACRIALQIATGLQAVHDQGVVHRDLKPENIFLVDQDGTKDFVKIVDFGIARRSHLVPSSDPNVSGAGAGPAVSADALAPISQPSLSTDSSGSDNRLTLAGTIMGTPHYMSPEQAVGAEIDSRSDQYALGCILYEMLTGSVPFDGSSQAILAKHVTVPVPAVRQRRSPRLDPVPAAVEQVLLRLLAKEPEGRFANMREVAKALQREIDVLLLARGERVLVAKSAAEVLTTGARPKVVVLFGRYVPLWLLFVPSLILLAVGGYVAYRQLVRRAPSDRLADGELAAARKRALDVVGAQLAQGSPASRGALLAALGQTHDPQIRPLLEATLQTSDIELQAQAAGALGLLADRQAVPALRRLFGTAGDDAVKIAVAGALDRLGQSEGARYLQQVLAGENPSSRTRAAYLLAEQGDRAAQELLSATAAEPDVPEEQLIRILARLAQAGDLSARTQLRERLLVPGRREHKLLAAAKLAQLGDEKGREFLHALATQAGPDQLPAARFLSTPEDPVGLALFRGVIADPQATAAARELACEGLAGAGQALDVRLLLPILGTDASATNTLTESTLAVVRAAALAILHIAGRQPSTLSDQSLAWARLALDDSDWVVRQSAAAVLGDSGSDKATTLLAKLVHDAEPRVRRSALRALGRRADRGAWLAVHEGLSDSDSSVRSEAVQALGKLGQTLSRMGLPGLLSEAQGWLQALLERGSPQEQLLASLALLRLGDRGQRERVLSFQLAENPEVRRLLVEHVDGESEVLHAALNDEVFAVRMMAARRLAERGDRRAIPVLNDALKRGGVLASSAYALLRRLGERAVQAADSDLLALSGTLEQRVQAIAALGQAPLDLALPLLRRVARDREPEIRRAIVEVLADIEHPAPAQRAALLSLLRGLSEDRDATVRARAEVLLARLAGAPETPSSPGVEPAAQPAGEPVVAPVAPAKEPTAEPVVEPASPPPEVAAEPSVPPVAAPETNSKPVEPTAVPHAAAVQAQDLARSAAQSLEAKDFDRARSLLERARKLCAKGRERRADCDSLLFDVSYQLARLHETQGHLAEAMGEYERAVKQAPTVNGKAREKSAVQDAVLRLVPKLGILIMPKQSGGACQEVSLWMTPGTHSVVVGGGSQTVQIKAHETVRVGSCK